MNRDLPRGPSFSPLLLLGLLLVAALMAGAALIPLVECPTCFGRGSFYRRNLGQKVGEFECPRCTSRKKVTLLGKWFRRMPPPYGK